MSDKDMIIQKLSRLYDATANQEMFSREETLNIIKQVINYLEELE